MPSLALAGWGLATLFGVWALVLRRRLELVGRAEHELRGPITALTLGAEALRRDPAGRRHADALESELTRVRLGLADLHAARSGARTPAQVSAVPLEELAHGTAAGWHPVARRAGGGVRLDWQGGRATVRADRRRLAQALSNLVSNAVEHGGGDVELRGRPTPGGVRIEVTDSGAGFAPAANGARPRRRVARPWGPDHGRPERGKGLAIAAGAVEEAGGRLSVVPSDRGATVAVELPTSATAGDAEPSDRRPASGEA